MKAYRKGLWAERLCVLYLMMKGFRILHRRFKSAVGEIDVIAQRGGLLIFVEVKYRKAAVSDPVVLRKQWKRIIRTAQYYLKYYVKKSHVPLNIRFDLMVLIGGLWPYHHQGVALWQEEKRFL